jgi:hypothetical protein
MENKQLIKKVIKKRKKHVKAKVARAKNLCYEFKDAALPCELHIHIDGRYMNNSYDDATILELCVLQSIRREGRKIILNFSKNGFCHSKARVITAIKKNVQNFLDGTKQIKKTQMLLEKIAEAGKPCSVCVYCSGAVHSSMLDEETSISIEKAIKNDQVQIELVGKIIRILIERS